MPHPRPRLHVIALGIGLALGLAACAAAPQRAGRPDPGDARVDGLWCGNGALREFSLLLRQQLQAVEGTLVRRDRVREITGRIDGSTLVTQTSRYGSLVLQVVGDELRIAGGDGPLALARGTSFHRATTASCGG